MPVTISKSSSAAGGMHGDFGLTDGEVSLHHVFFELLCQPGVGHLLKHWREVGSMRFKMSFSQARLKGICLLSFDARDVVNPLPHAQKDILLNIKLVSCYCEENGKPIMDGTNFPRLGTISSGLALQFSEQLRR